MPSDIVGNRRAATLGIVFPVLVAALLQCSSVAVAAQKKGVGWPFGVAPANAGRFPAKRDLFNLGLIGAKAWDADREEPAARQGGRRSFSPKGKRGPDVGPRRLVVRALFGRGPAQRAGLKLGDVIVGVGQKSFKKGAYGPLANALKNAEATKGKLALQVERAGERMTIDVKIPTAGAVAKKPTEGKHRDKLVRDSLKWLQKRQQGDGGFEATLGGRNGQIVNTCLAGLAWIAGGSSLRAGKHRAQIKKARGFVEKHIEAPDPMASRRAGGASWDQTNWAYVHAILFLGELQIASGSKKLKAKVQKLADELCRRQVESGGYPHGPGGLNALGYLELNILGGYAMSALGVAHRAGCTVDGKVIDQLNAYLEASASGDGGVGYSTKRGQKGMGNIGRTAAAWLGVRALGKGSTRWGKKMQGYVRKNVGNVMGGHASLMQHIMLAGLAAKASGKKTTRAYWKVLERDLTLARAPDGSFQMRPWHESLLMESNSDVSMGEVWSTASWAIVLAADDFKSQRGGLRGWLGVGSQ